MNNWYFINWVSWVLPYCRLSTYIYRSVKYNTCIETQQNANIYILFLCLSVFYFPPLSFRFLSVCPMLFIEEKKTRSINKSSHLDLVAVRVYMCVYVCEMCSFKYALNKNIMSEKLRHLVDQENEKLKRKRNILNFASIGSIMWKYSHRVKIIAPKRLRRCGHGQPTYIYFAIRIRRKTVASTASSTQ